MLLILAGISIQMLTGDNGILTRAGEAKERNDDAQIEEKLKLAIVQMEMEYFSGHEPEDSASDYIFTHLEKLKSILDAKDGELEANREKKTITYKTASVKLGESGLKISTEQIEGKFGRIILKVTANLDGYKDINVRQYLESLSEDELKDMYAAMYTSGNAVWSQCLGSFSSVKDYYEKTQKNSGYYTDEYDMMIKQNKVNMNQYLVEKHGIKVYDWIRTLTEQQLKAMYAKCYTNGQVTWDVCMSSYTSVKDYYEKTQKNSGYYTDEYDMMIKKGYIDEDTIETTLAKTTIVVNGESKKVVDTAEFVIESNGEYRVDAFNEDDITGTTIVKISGCYVAGYNNPYIPEGFSYVEGSGDWNHGYTIKGNGETANADNEFVWVPCVYEQSQIESGDNVKVLGKITTGNYTQSSITSILQSGTITRWNN